MATSRHHDLIIIGTGSGNSLVTPALEGLDIAIVEEQTFGGTCLNVGCIPTKMFVLPADLVESVRAADRLGVDVGPASVRWRDIRDRVFGRIDPIAAGGESYRRSQESVTVYGERVRFVGERRLQLASGEVVSGERVVVAAGGRPRGLTIRGLEAADPERGVHTSDTIMRVDEVPERLVIVGGGFIATEFAHVFDAYGSRVTWVHRGELLLKAEDAQVSARYTALAQQRYDLRLRSQVIGASRSDDGVWSVVITGPRGESMVEADAILLAAGRVPNTDRLDASAGGLALHGDGRIVVDAQQRTSVDGVYALGDISSAYQLKHVANHEARVVAHNLAVDLGREPGEMVASDHRFVPHAVFGHPQIAAFGPTRAELEAAGTAYVAKTQAFGDVAYGWAMEDTSGSLTVYADPASRRVVAAHCIGYQASTVIQPLIQAASFGHDALEVARGQYWIHPALAEVVENALLGLPFE